MISMETLKLTLDPFGDLNGADPRPLAMLLVLLAGLALAACDDADANVPTSGASDDVSTDYASLGPFFDCKDAELPVEFLICDDGELSALDYRMSETYLVRRAELMEGAAERQLEDQREWLIKRSTLCGVPQIGDLDPAQKDSWKRCLKALYWVRIDYLNTTRFENDPQEHGLVRARADAGHGNKGPGHAATGAPLDLEDEFRLGMRLAKEAHDSAMRRKAAWHLTRVLVNKETEAELILDAMFALKQMQSEFQSTFQGITPEEMERARGSVGVVILNKGDAERGIRVMIEEAWLWNTGAIIMLRIQFEYATEGRPAHNPEILEYFRESAELGVPRSQFIFGKALYYGWGTPPNKSAAVDLLTKSNMPGAHVTLAHNALRSSDEALAEKHFLTAAEMENADGYYGAGVIARDRRDFKAALTRFTKALELRPKFWEATTHVAEIHLNGWGVPKDEPKAFSLLKALADEDNVPYGQYLVGSFYAKGIGTTRSIPDAVAYLTKSAKNGNEAAKNLLVILENRQQP